jgi:hypothetical protein
MGIETSAAELARPAWPTTPALRLRAVAEAAEPSQLAGRARQFLIPTIQMSQVLRFRLFYVFQSLIFLFNPTVSGILKKTCSKERNKSEDLVVRTS